MSAVDSLDGRRLVGPEVREEAEQLLEVGRPLPDEVLDVAVLAVELRLDDLDWPVGPLGDAVERPDAAPPRSEERRVGKECRL